MLDNNVSDGLGDLIQNGAVLGGVIENLLCVMDRTVAILNAEILWSTTGVSKRLKSLIAL